MTPANRDGDLPTVGVDAPGLESRLTPARIVEALDRHVVGQRDAKRAVAVAIRNRWRRMQLSEAMRKEVLPRNILLIGPTGVGKTEIARRIARLIGAPFTKVEATKFTEVGYVGRDVEQIVRDLLENAMTVVQAREREKVRTKAREKAQQRVLDALVAQWQPGDTTLDPLGFESEKSSEGAEPTVHDLAAVRARLKHRLASGALDDEDVQIELEEQRQVIGNVFDNAAFAQTGIDFKSLMERMQPKRTQSKRMKVKEAVEAIANEEAGSLVDEEAVAREAVTLVENHGIVFLDEIDKVAGRTGGSGPDISREGVQRDLLPLVEGSTVSTRHGPVKTDHILFIGAGAFHVSKPSDLLPELQGRFPIRVRLEALTEADFIRILTEPEGALTRQYEALLGAEKVKVQFSEDGISELARVAAQANEQHENIGARRLATVMERVLEEISFEAPERKGERIQVDRSYVQTRIGDLVEDRDLGRYVL